MIKITQLSVTLSDKLLLTDLSLEIAPGTVHVCMGPNGSGKSSLALTIMGHPRYHVTQGTIMFQETDITNLSVDKRARLGIFLSLQQPYEIPGVTLSSFLKEAFCAIYGADELDTYVDRLTRAVKLLHIDPDFLQREVHVGFSGGEKKRCEMLQLLVLQPKLAILDEIDSGLDVDALKIVINGLQAFRKMSPDSSILLITHYVNIFQEFMPDAVSLMQGGSVIKTGGMDIIKQIETSGYK